MDGRRRLAQSLTSVAPLRTEPHSFAAVGPRVQFEAAMPPSLVTSLGKPILGKPMSHRLWGMILKLQLPRGVGLAAALLVMCGGLIYGVIKGDHVPEVIELLDEARNEAANAAGFRIVSIAVSGNQHLKREEVIGLTAGKTSLLFLDVAAMRKRLESDPWVAEATVLKLYPGELQIDIKERVPFALWQSRGSIVVIADDGTLLESYQPGRLVQLPLVVGLGSNKRAKELLALVDRHPAIRDQLLASVMVGERRWNLRLRNGLDVRLPETDVAQALDRLADLERDAKLTSRDILHIDLRLPDRVTVRLAPGAAQSRADALKEKKPPAKKGGNA
ncbi:MAG TPA: cell division protein FtsQ/DivIB [Xanthobacteraceae bacterium]|jgi:cell division protein FtsQ|nr:cell division protein FtsQ/DivIB [Xanthobacteraceae bacterium]